MRERILVIDDDAVIRRLLQRLLAGRGFDVQLASDGEQGLALLRSEDTPRALICDLLLPGISGLDVMREIRGDERLRSLPVLMLTGEGFDETRGAALEQGADMYMTKPFSSYELLDALGQLLSGKTRGGAAGSGSKAA